MARRTRVARHGGFTLIELMIVVTCIGVLSSLAIPAYVGLKARTARSEMLMQLGQLVQDARAYYRLNATFPPMGSYSCGIAFPAPVNTGETGSVSGAFNPCAPLGTEAPMVWGDKHGDDPASFEPWKSLGQKINAAVVYSRVRYVAGLAAGGGPAAFQICALHDFDANGQPGLTCATLTASPGGDAVEDDTGWEDGN